MYVALVGPKGKQSVSIREDYMDPVTGKKKARIIETLGPYKRLLEENPDFLEELKEEVRERTRILREEKNVMVTLGTGEVRRSEDGYRPMHIGHAVIKKIWDDMKMDRFFEERCGRRNADRLRNALFYLMCRRLSSPSSVRRSSFMSDFYVGIEDITPDILYEALEELGKHKEALIEHLDAFFKRSTRRELSHVCYDVTNYYFESTECGELRLFGYSKDGKKNEVLVVMGLLIDSNGIPISFQLFPGNTMDQNTLKEAVSGLKEKYGFGEITVVADRGMNSGENLIYIAEEGHHFLMSYALKRAGKDIKNKALGEDIPWEEIIRDKDGEISFASKRLYITVGAKVLLSEEERQKDRRRKYRYVDMPAILHVTYSAKRAAKDRADRNRAVEKLKKRIATGKVASSMRYGCNRYLDTEIDCKGAGIDIRKIEEEEKWDGYYAVATDRTDLSTSDVSGMYGEQWTIESSFRILKTDLEARPVFVWKDERIIGHFTLCYLCLSVIRYMQHLYLGKTGENISAERIMDALDSAEAIPIGEEEKPYLGVSLSDDYIEISRVMGLPFLQKTMTPVRFRHLTKLDPTASLAKLIGKP